MLTFEKICKILIAFVIIFMTTSVLGGKLSGRRNVAEVKCYAGELNVLFTTVKSYEKSGTIWKFETMSGEVIETDATCVVRR